MSRCVLRASTGALATDGSDHVKRSTASQRHSLPSGGRFSSTRTNGLLGTASRRSYATRSTKSRHRWAAVSNTADAMTETQSPPDAISGDRPQGLTLRPDGSAKLVVWAPMAGNITLQLSSEASRTWTTIPVPQEVLDKVKEWETAPEPQVVSDYKPEGPSYELSKGEGGNWQVELPSGVVKPGTPYRSGISLGLPSHVRPTRKLRVVRQSIIQAISSQCPIRPNYTDCL
jgi:hypothetical protein